MKSHILLEKHFRTANLSLDKRIRIRFVCVISNRLCLKNPNIPKRMNETKWNCNCAYKCAYKCSWEEGKKHDIVFGARIREILVIHQNEKIIEWVRTKLWFHSILSSARIFPLDIFFSLSILRHFGWQQSNGWKYSWNYQ